MYLCLAVTLFTCDITSCPGDKWHMFVLITNNPHEDTNKPMSNLFFGNRNGFTIYVVTQSSS